MSELIKLSEAILLNQMYDNSKAKVSLIFGSLIFYRLIFLQRA